VDLDVDFDVEATSGVLEARDGDGEIAARRARHLSTSSPITLNVSFRKSCNSATSHPERARTCKAVGKFI
jgi:hypothetical protein